LSDPVIRILYGPRFLPAIPVLGLLAAFASAKALMFPAQDLLVAANRQAALLKIMTFTACLNILLDFLLIPSGGAMGAAVANSVSQTAAAVAVWWASLRGFEVRFPMVSFSRLLLAAAACGAIALGLVLWIPGLPGAVAAMLAGTLVYALGLRLMQPLEPGDRERLCRLEAQLPAPLRNPYRRLLFSLFPGA
jgi:O-antigen/teichoic acid export membrane protein